MHSSFRILLIIAIAGLIIAGCAGNNSQPIAPDESVSPTGLTGSADASGDSARNSHYLLAYNLLYVDPDNPDGPKIEIIPVREGEIHLNILKFLEGGPCTNCFKIVGFDIPQPGYLDVDIEIKHPFTDLLLSVFDVRGIMMFNGSHTFPASGKTMSDLLLGDSVLLNPDGYTSLYNGSTITAPVGALQKYYPGKFSTPAIPDSDINGYRYHVTDDPPNYRNAFFAGSSDVQTYSLKFSAGPFVIGYAVDANWWTPVSEPVDDPLTDFDSNANCPEPWKIEVGEQTIGSGLTDQGGQTKLIIDVYDWQGKSTHHDPVVECPELFDGAVTATWLNDGADYAQYQATISNTKLASIGGYECLVGAEANENDPTGKPWLDLTAYQIFFVVVVPQPATSITVTAPDGGESWQGGTSQDITWTYTGSITNVAIYYSTDGGLTFPYEITGSTECNGIFAWNPIPDTPTTTAKVKIVDASNASVYDISNSNFTIFNEVTPTITVISPNGGEFWIAGTTEQIQWTSQGVTGNVKIEYFNDISWISIVDDTANDGSYDWLIPNDPSNAARVQISSVSSPGISDISDAIFMIWPPPTVVVIAPNGGETWYAGSTQQIQWTTLSVSGAIKIEYFNGTDWKLVVDNEANDGFYDWLIPDDPTASAQVMVSSVMAPGVFDTSDAVFTISPTGWARTWGAGIEDEGKTVAIDSFNNVYVGGFFVDSVDFDPGEGEDIHNSVDGSYDAFLSKFDSVGNFVWVRTWGAANNESVKSISVDGSGNIFVAGFFGDTVDFDPGGGVDEHTSGGNLDVFLSKFDPDGDFAWARTWTWGGAYYSWGPSVAVDSSGDAYVTGYFQGTVDFDPGVGVDNHTSNGNWDASLSKIYASGNFGWARTWGGTSDDEGLSVAVDPSSGNVYVTGYFYESIDLDPGTGTFPVTSNGSADGFLSKFYPLGSFITADTWGGVQKDVGRGVTVDNWGNTYVIADYDADTAMLVKRDSSCVVKWGFANEADLSINNGVAVDSSGNTYITGDFQGDWLGPDGILHSSSGQSDAFLLRRDSAGNESWLRTWGADNNDIGRGVAVTSEGYSYVTGFYYNQVDFNPGSGTDNHTSNGESDVFLSKFLPNGLW
jgi:hypothetical protein